MSALLPILMIAGYVLTGLAAILLVDNARRWVGTFDRIGSLAEICLLVLWPLALPWHMWVHRHGRR